MSRCTFQMRVIWHRLPRYRAAQRPCHSSKLGPNIEWACDGRWRCELKALMGQERSMLAGASPGRASPPLSGPLRPLWSKRFSAPGDGNNTHASAWSAKWIRAVKIASIVLMAILQVVLLASVAHRQYILPESMMRAANHLDKTTTVISDSFLRARSHLLNQIAPNALIHSLTPEELAHRIRSGWSDASLGIDRNAFCRLAALIPITESNSSNVIEFKEPVVDVWKLRGDVSSPSVDAEASGEWLPMGSDGQLLSGSALVRALQTSQRTVNDTVLGLSGERSMSVHPRGTSWRRRRPAISRGVILTTYFSSRIDPLRCSSRAGGRVAADDAAYLLPWYLSVRRLGLAAVVFHDSLSEAFVLAMSTDKIAFQRVAPGHQDWSLCDERWAVYSAWAKRGGMEPFDYVVQVDASDAIFSKTPWAWLAAHASSDLWINVQQSTKWTAQNYALCYPPHQVPPDLPVGGGRARVYNAGVVAGRKDAFIALARAMTDELAMLYEERGGVAWNCDMATLQAVLTRASFLAEHRVWHDGPPFCSGSIKCWQHGECDTLIYHK